MEAEKTIWTGSTSQIVNLGAYLLSGLVFVLLMILLVWQWSNVAAQPVFLIAALLIVMLPLGYGLVKWISVKMVRYEVTSERIRITTGILSKRTNALELYRVKDYILEEPFLMRLFKFGKIVILTSDVSTPRLELEAVPRARWLVDQLRAAVEARRDAKRVRAVDFDAEPVPPNE